MHLSPASTGNFQGKWRLAGAYRSQWQSVPVSYRTYSFSADWKAIQRKKSLISLGVMLQQDAAGDANLSWAQGGLNLSASHRLGKSNWLSLGFGFSALQRTVDISRLKFKNQWVSDGYDPSLPSREPFGRSSGISTSLSTGLLWHYRSTENRHSLNLGMGAFHLNKPVVNLGGVEETKLPIRIPVFAEGFYQIRERSDLVTFAALQTMRSAREIVIGAGLRQILTNELANITSVRATLSLRLGDAIIAAVQLERNNWLIGISYDWNVSGFRAATDGRGGIEIAAVWRVVPVEVSKVVKCCPVF